MYDFFFQAEDGIRDSPVTGVQTCALPISIDAGNVTRHFSFSGEEDTTFKVVGFTLKNGLSNSGGSIYIGNSSPQFNNCTISDNKSSGSGGAIYIYNNESAPIFNNCVITSNVFQNLKLISKS